MNNSRSEHRIQCKGYTFFKETYIFRMVFSFSSVFSFISARIYSSTHIAEIKYKHPANQIEFLCRRILQFSAQPTIVQNKVTWYVCANIERRFETRTTTWGVLQNDLLRASCLSRCLPSNKAESDDDIKWASWCCAAAKEASRWVRLMWNNINKIVSVWSCDLLVRGAYWGTWMMGCNIFKQPHYGVDVIGLSCGLRLGLCGQLHLW